jgi:hypothetical protein
VYCHETLISVFILIQKSWSPKNRLKVFVFAFYDGNRYVQRVARKMRDLVTSLAISSVVCGDFRSGSVIIRAVVVCKMFVLR